MPRSTWSVLQMVLHHAEDPAGVLAEAARVLRPGGRLIVIELAAHGRQDLTARLAHRWPGFSDAADAPTAARCRHGGRAPPSRCRARSPVQLWSAATRAATRAAAMQDPESDVASDVASDVRP